MPKFDELYIVGPTASGKSSLAMKVSQKWRGELICSDSQTVRKKLDIGTAKPTEKDRAIVPHHMLDVIEPFAEFSVAEFQSMAKKMIAEVKSRNHLPIIVGGSGMYVDSLYYDYTLGEQESTYNREELEQKSVEQLQKIVHKNTWPMPENERNPRHLVGLILRGGKVLDDRVASKPHKLIVGLLPDDDTLKQRITNRVELMVQVGFVDEVRKLREKYGEFPEKMDAIGYPIMEQVVLGKKTPEEAKAEFVRGDWQYARKQKAWFKRNPHIVWFEHEKEALEFIESSMSENQ